MTSLGCCPVVLGITGQQVGQLTANGLINGAEFGLLAVGFALMLGVVGRFNFAYGWVYAMGGYLTYTLANPDGIAINIWLAMAIGVVGTVIVGVATEALVFGPIARRAGSGALMTVFIASLGLAVVGENLIRLFWGSSPLNFFPALQAVGFKVNPIRVGEVVFTNIKLYRALSAVVLVAAIAATMRWTALGRSIKATRSNPELAAVLGIATRRVHLAVFAIASAAAGLAGFWSGVEFSLQPIMGGQALFFAVIAAFLAGPTRSPIRIFATGVLLALLEQYASLWIDSQRAQLAVFALLLVYLIARSLNLQTKLMNRGWWRTAS